MAKKTKPTSIIKKSKSDLSYINPTLHQFAVGLSDLKLDGANPRKHTDRNLDVIKESLSKFGQQTPVVFTRGGVVVKGNGTFMAAKALGWGKIAAIPTSLSQESDVSAYKITDNKSADLATWDFEALASYVKNSPEIDWIGLGWQQYELDPLLEAVWEKPSVGQTNGVDGGTGETKSLTVTIEQWGVIERAVDKAMESADDQDMSVGRALELICGDYLGS